MYYIEENNKVKAYNEDLKILEYTIQKCMPKYSKLQVKQLEDGYVIYNFEVMTIDEMNKIITQKERERIGNLTCTKRVFALMLKELGITYNKLKELVATNEDAQLEWDLCVELLRNNPLLDIMGQQLGVTSEQLDKLFQYANGEITLEEFKNENTTDNTEDIDEL